MQSARLPPMSTPLKGIVRGTTITLDAPVPPLDGKRVVVVLALDDASDAGLAPNIQSETWRAWSERGPQGPIEDEGDAEFP